jgi:hypothetical protein
MKYLFLGLFVFTSCRTLSDYERRCTCICDIPKPVVVTTCKQLECLPCPLIKRDRDRCKEELKTCILEKYDVE